MQESTAPRLTRSPSSTRCGSSDPSLPQVPSCLWPTCAKRLQVHERGAMGGDQSPKPIKPVRQWDNQETNARAVHRAPFTPLNRTYMSLKSNALFQKAAPHLVTPFHPSHEFPAPRSAGGHRVPIRRDPAISTGGPLGRIGRQRVVVIGRGGRVLRRNRGK